MTYRIQKKHNTRFYARSREFLFLGVGVLVAISSACKTNPSSTEISTAQSSGDNQSPVEERFKLELKSEATGDVLAVMSNGDNRVTPAINCRLRFESYIFDANEERADASLDLDVENAFGSAGIPGKSLQSVRRQLPPYQDISAQFRFESFGYELSYDGRNLNMIRKNQIFDQPNASKYYLGIESAVIETSQDLRKIGSIKFTVKVVETDQNFIPLNRKKPLYETTTKCDGGLMK